MGEPRPLRPSAIRQLAVLLDYPAQLPDSTTRPNNPNQRPGLRSHQARQVAPPSRPSVHQGSMEFRHVPLRLAMKQAGYPALASPHECTCGSPANLPAKAKPGDAPPVPAMLAGKRDDGPSAALHHCHTRKASPGRPTLAGMSGRIGRGHSTCQITSSRGPTAACSVTGHTCRLLDYFDQ